MCMLCSGRCRGDGGSGSGSGADSSGNSSGSGSGAGNDGSGSDDSGSGNSSGSGSGSGSDSGSDISSYDEPYASAPVPHCPRKGVDVMRMNSASSVLHGDDEAYVFELEVECGLTRAEEGRGGWAQ